MAGYFGDASFGTYAAPYGGLGFGTMGACGPMGAYGADVASTVNKVADAKQLLADKKKGMTPAEWATFIANTTTGLTDIFKPSTASAADAPPDSGAGSGEMSTGVKLAMYGGAAVVGLLGIKFILIPMLTGK